MTNKESVYQAIANFINDNDCFLIATHIKPDGDTLGSAAAVAEILTQKAKKFTIINAEATNNKYNFLPHYHQIKPIEQLTEAKYTNVITVDCADIERVGEQFTSLLTEQATIVNIDHHPTNTNYGNINLVDADAASTTVVIWELAKSLDIRLNKCFATAIYTGLMTDTGSFRYSNTSSKTHLIAAELLELGVVANQIANRIYETMTQTSLQILRDSLATLEYDETGRIGWIEKILPEDLQTEDELEDIINYPRSVATVEVAISFRQADQETVKISLRSKTDLDVSKIAQAYGGGGHVKAAGCTFNGTVAAAKAQVIAAVKKALIESYQS